MDCKDVNGLKYVDCPQFGFHLPYKICTDPCYMGLKYDKEEIKKKKKELKNSPSGDLSNEDGRAGEPKW